jgi:hypothetical protein
VGGKLCAKGLHIDAQPGQESSRRPGVVGQQREQNVIGASRSSDRHGGPARSKATTTSFPNGGFYATCRLLAVHGTAARGDGGRAVEQSGVLRPTDRNDSAAELVAV